LSGPDFGWIDCRLAYGERPWTPQTPEKAFPGLIKAYPHLLFLSTSPIMPPKRNANDVLTHAEDELMKIAVRLDSALRYREANRDLVSDAWYVQSIEDELVRIHPLCVLRATN
jgi:hypothetical protein